ncbi:hypothetical protein VitviT2T_012867 [Vitis vinifera]|uniref:Dirigent protein n=3 Tax=Vitis vinifera TaxID=29760 RepID=A0ABY9CHJ5_VITVI
MTSSGMRTRSAEKSMMLFSFFHLRFFSTMARSLILFTIFLSTIAADAAASGASGESHRFSRNLSPKSIGLKHEKLSHLHFYFHDIVTDPNPTTVRVAEATMSNTLVTTFGDVFVMDDPLTVGPEPSSKLVGRAQGIYASAWQEEVGLLMVMNFAFMEGKYNGSTLSVLGRNTIFSEVREMPIIGGSGLFRFARGYVEARTHSFNVKSGNAVVEYNV